MTVLRRGGAPDERAPARTHDRPSRVTDPEFCVGLAAIVALGAGLMLRRIGDAPLWRDEIWTSSISSRSLGGVFDVMANRETNMGLYYLTAHGWLSLDGGDGWLRTLSVVFALGAVVMTALFVRDVLGNVWGLVSAVVLGLNPFFFWYAREARAYSMVIFMAAAAIFFFGRASASSRIDRWMVLYGLFAVLGVYTQLLFVFLVASHAATLAVNRRITRSWVIVHTAILALVSPLVLYVLASGRGHPDWLDRPTVGDLIEFGGTALGYDRTQPWTHLVVPLTCAVLLVVGVAAIAEQAYRPVVAGALIATIGPVMGIWLISQAKPLFLARYMVWVLPYLTFLLVLGLSRLPSRPTLGIASCALILFPWLRVDLAYSDQIKGEDPRAATAHVVESSRPGDVVLFRPAWSRVVYEQYRDGRATSPEDVAIAADGSMLETGDIVAREISAAELEEALEGARRVWVVGYPDSNWSITSEPARQMESASVESGEWTLQDERDFGDLNVRLYEVDPS